MSVQFTQQPQVVQINVDPHDEEDDRQRLQSPGARVPLDRMTSRLNPYSQVQEQLTQVQLDLSREERAERVRVRRIFDKVRINKCWIGILVRKCGYFCWKLSFESFFAG